MTYSISCVLVIPVTLQAAANTLIDSYGYGPGNLSVAVEKISDSSAWRGCHVWCDQEFIDFIQANQASVFLGQMIMSSGPGPANTNWASTLAANGLRVPAGQL